MGAGMEDPEDAIDDRTKIVKGMACLAVMSRVRQEARDPRPLWLGELITAHGRTDGETAQFGSWGYPLSYSSKPSPSKDWYTFD